MRCTRRVTSCIIIFILLIFAVSCNKDINFGFKELCFYHPHTAPVRVKVDWNFFRHLEQPTGMTVYVWSRNNPNKNKIFLTHKLNSVNLDLEAGFYDAFVYNQSEDEYSTIEFHNLHDFNKAEARVIQVKSNWLNTKHPSTKVGAEPEWLAIDCVRDIEVTQEMVERAEAEYLANLPEANKQLQQQKTRDVTRTENEVGPLVPTSIIKNVDIYVHLENLIYLRSALGAVGDMAEGCYISSKQTTERRVTHTMNSWGVVYGQTSSGSVNMMKGAIKVSLSTFGLPAGHRGLPEDNNLYIRLLLVDNSTILEKNFPIGDLLADLNEYDGTQLDKKGTPIWPEVHVYWPEPLPEVEAVGSGSGGFDVAVDDWGEDITTILPLM